MCQLGLERRGGRTPRLGLLAPGADQRAPRATTNGPWGCMRQAAP